MLFAIRPALEPSRVFDGLNRLLREVMLAALEGRAVNPNVLPVGLHAAVAGRLRSQSSVVFGVQA